MCGALDCCNEQLIWWATVWAALNEQTLLLCPGPQKRRMEKKPCRNEGEISFDCKYCCNLGVMAVTFALWITVLFKPNFISFRAGSMLRHYLLVLGLRPWTEPFRILIHCTPSPRGSMVLLGACTIPCEAAPQLRRCDQLLIVRPRQLCRHVLPPSDLGVTRTASGSETRTM